MSEENELPSGWVQTTLGNVLPIQYGKGLVEAIRDPNGHVPVFGSSGIVGSHSQALTSKATLIIGRKGSIGSVHYSSMPCWPIDTTYFVEESANLYLKFFLYLLSFLKLNQLDKSTAIPGLSRDDYNVVVVKVAPLPEQHRIVAAIEQQFSRLDAGVAALRQAQAKLKRYRAAVLKAAVEGKLTAAWRAEHPTTEPASRLLERILAERRAKWEADLRAKEKDPAKVRYVEPAKPDVESLPEVPEGWCWATVGQCFEVHVGATPSRKRPEYWRGDIPWVSSGEVQFCRIQSTREHITWAGLSNSSTQISPVGSVLLGMIGEGRTRGQVAMLDVEACNNQNCAAIWVSRTSIVPEYIYYWLWSQYDVIRQGSSGNNQPALNKARVEQMIFTLPPLTEQQQIVAEVEQRLSVISQLEATVAANLKRAERLRQSILKEAFAGRLVPQDPSDEPASILLERIRKECDERKHGAVNKGRVVSIAEPVKIDVSETKQVELWESVGGERTLFAHRDRLASLSVWLRRIIRLCSLLVHSRTGRAVGLVFPVSPLQFEAV